jgi:hypothetical protein
MTARTPRTFAAASQLITAESLQALSDTEFAAVQERIAAEESHRLAATCLRPPRPALFLTGVIRGIDIRDPPWPYPVQLDDGFLMALSNSTHQEARTIPETDFTPIVSDRRGVLPGWGRLLRDLQPASAVPRGRDVSVMNGQKALRRRHRMRPSWSVIAWLPWLLLTACVASQTAAPTAGLERPAVDRLLTRGEV